MSAGVLALCERLAVLLGREVVLSTAVFAAVLAIWWIGGRRRAAFAYALWTLVLLRLVLPPSLGHPWSVGTLLETLTASSASASGELAAGPMDVSSGVLAASVAASAPAGPSWSAWSSVALVALYLVGLLLWGTRFAGRLRRLRRLVRDASSVQAGPVFEQLAAWRERLGIRRGVELRVTQARVSPFTVGLLRPVVVLPSAILADAIVTESAVAHELAHVARWDSLQLRLQQLVQAIYFFHPVAHLAGRGLSEERERLCDALVLARGTLSPKQYAHSLVTVLKLEPLALEAPSLVNRQRRLSMRLRTVLANSDAASEHGSWHSVLAVAVLAFFLLPLAGVAGGEPQVPKPSAEPQSQAKPASSLLLANPLPNGEITSCFGPAVNPFTQKKDFHKGIDVRSPLGTPVLAAAAGTVEVATTDYENPDAGTVVIVNHGEGWKTYYGHLGELKVEPGQRIGQAEPLAGVGTSGLSTGPHLHFEIWQRGEKVDPASMVRDWTGGGC